MADVVAQFIRDPVHGYIEVPDELDLLVRTPALQRLRSIRQNSVAFIEFPSMTGTRYEHALGTMHLAIRAWQGCWRNGTPAAEGIDTASVWDGFRRAVIEDLRHDGAALDPVTSRLVEGPAGQPEQTMLWIRFEQVIGLAVGAVGLLHDIGHPPYSHVLEPFYAEHAVDIFGAERQADFASYAAAATDDVQFHEWAGLAVFDAIPPDAFARLPRRLIRRIFADRSGHGWASCLHSIIDGQFDVDRLDFLCRDAAGAGTEFGHLDIANLLRSLELHRTAVDDWRIGLGARALASFETLLLQRAQHYRWVVQQHKVVAANAALVRTVSELYTLSRDVPALGALLPDLDYVSHAPVGGDGCLDDPGVLGWLRAARPVLASLDADASPAGRAARGILALLRIFDPPSLVPIAAWRDYHEFVARIEQNGSVVAALVGSAGPAELPDFLTDKATREAVAALASDVPARLNAALDRVLRPGGHEADLHEAERWLTAAVPAFAGPGRWLVARTEFHALHDDRANIWRGDASVQLGDLSPLAVALAAIQVMRPRYLIFFVPYDGPPHEPTLEQRRALGAVLLQQLVRRLSAQEQQTADTRVTGLGQDNPQAYLPGDRRRAIAAGQQLPDRVRGSALFADISGFTPLTEALAEELGPRRGAEELTAALDAVFTDLLTTLDAYGGEVIYFSGDAVTAWLDGDDGTQGIACGFAMQRVLEDIGLRRTPNGREFRIGLKVAVSVGQARRFVVGDPEVQRIDGLAGALMDRLAAAADDAVTGDVLVDADTAAGLGDRAQLGEARGTAGAWQVRALAEPPSPLPERPPLPVLPEDVVRQWVLPPVYERIAGGGEFLAELRPVVPLFLKFEGIDYDDDPDAIGKLDELVVAAQRAVAVNGGNVLQLTIGDKGAYLYAVFGSPIAHEDDAARACASALDLLQLSGPTAARRIRIGIASGALRSGSYGHPERRTFACLGDATNLAARLMSATGPDSILVAPEIRRAAGAAFQWAQPRELKVKGKTAPILVSQLLAWTGSTRALAGTGTPLLGRDAELATLEAFAREAATGHGHVVAITGAPGTGKSRLLAELGERVRQQGVRTRSGAPRSYGARTVYGVWQDIARDAWRLPAADQPDEVVQRLEYVLAGADPRLLPRLPLLGPLAGVTIPDTTLTASFDAKLRKTSLESLIVEVLEASAAQGPVAFLIDAGEHLDELSWDLFEAIGRAVPRLPILLVVSHRALSEPVERLAALPHVDTVELGPLDAQTSRQLVHDRLRTRSESAAAEPLVERIATLGAGNPFHLEELVNHVAATGASDHGQLGLPESLQSLQLARIDGLPEAPRRTIKVASVVGVRFDVPTVAGSYPELGTQPQVAEQTQRLVAAALVVGEDDEQRNFAFRSAITQQVAYETLPFATRSSLHDRIVRWLETSSPAGADAILDVLAFHARHGTDTARQRDYLVRAGVAAQQRYANEAAVDYFTAALPLVPDAERPELLRRLGKVQEIRGRWPDAQQTYQQALELCTERGDERGAAFARTNLAEVARKQGRFPDAEVQLSLAEQTFTRLGDLVGLGEVLHLRGTLASQQSHYDDARAAYRASLEIRRELGDAAKVGALLSNLAVVAEQEGDYDTSRELNEQALAVRTEVGDPWAIAVSQNNLGMIALLQEDWTRATTHIDESTRLATDVGDMWIVAVNQHNRGIAQRGLGRLAESGAAYLAALQAYVDYDDHWSLAQLFEDVAFLAVDRGLSSAALRLVGAADTLRRELDAPRPPAPAALLDAALAPVRAELGEAVAAGELATGAALPLAAAADLVREVCKS